MSRNRYALCVGTEREVKAYLPENYMILMADDETKNVFIAGYDYAGWTLDGYVIPRCNSGLIFVQEISPDNIGSEMLKAMGKGADNV